LLDASLMKKESIEHKFQYHPLDKPEQRLKVDEIYKQAWTYAQFLMDNIPESSNRDIAIKSVKDSILYSVEALRECETKV